MKYLKSMARLLHRDYVSRGCLDQTLTFKRLAAFEIILIFMEKQRTFKSVNLVRGRPKTTLTVFYPILTTYLPIVDVR